MTLSLPSWTPEIVRRRSHLFLVLGLGLVLLLLTLHSFHGAKAPSHAEVLEHARRAMGERTVPEPMPGCPGFILGKNVSFTRRGPRILISTGAYNNVVDGVSKTLNRLVGDLQRRDFQVIVVAPTAAQPALLHEGILYPAFSVSLPFRPEYRVALGLDKCSRQLFEAFDPDIVHVASPDYLGAKVQAWANSLNKPVACSYHTRFNSYLPYYIGSGNFLTPVDSAVWAWMRSFYNLCHHTYPPTPSVAQELQEHKITSEMRLWPRGIDLALFNPGRRKKSIREAWGVGDDTLVVLTVSRLVWEKNLQEIIDTITLLEEHGEPFKAVVVGDGPARAAMETKLPHAIFTGFLGGTNLSEAFASADIFFFPSLTETWGAVTLEAMASGLPVIVADAPGSKELVESGVTGYLVTPGRPMRWANAITELLHNEALRTRLGENCISKVANSNSFTWKRATNMLISHYRDLLDTNRRYKNLFEVE
jgi:glycosyltransferase involved in cell wall biosynthesis